MLSTIFSYIRGRFRALANKFSDIADWFLDQGWPWYYLATPFQSLESIADRIADYFYDAYKAARTIEDILDDAWSKAKQAFNYAYDVLRVRVNDALNLAQDAWDYAYDVLSRRVNDALDAAGDAFDWAYTAYKKARDAWDYASGWLTDRANEAYSKAVWAFDQIAAAVTAAAQEIYAWVKAIPAEIRAFVEGVVADIGAITTDIVQSLINTAMATIAAPINLVNLWFDDIQDFFNDPWGWIFGKFTDWFLGSEK